MHVEFGLVNLKVMFDHNTKSFRSLVTDLFLREDFEALACQ